jgi:hypothetical protein
VAFAAQNGGDASHGSFLPDLALGGSRDECLWVDAVGRGAADVGILCVAQSAEGEAGHEDSQLGQPEDFDVCAGGGIRADFAVVDSGGAAVGKNDVNPGAVSGIAVRDFLGRNSDCGNGPVLQGGNSEFAAGEWEDAVAGEPGGAGDVYGVDAGWVGVDVAAKQFVQLGRRRGATFECGSRAPAFTVCLSSPNFDWSQNLVRKSGSFAVALPKWEKIRMAVEIISNIFSLSVASAALTNFGWFRYLVKNYLQALL